MLFASLGALGASATMPGTLELMLVTAGGLLPARRPGRAALVLRRLAVVVPAHNEEKNVARTVASLREARHPCPVEILVIADNCSDAIENLSR